MKKHLAAAAALLLLAAPARAADSVKIGFVTTLSGPAGVIGKHMKDSADLALAMLGGKIGGLPAEIVYGDDQFKPDVGRQVTDELLTRDKVDFMTGYIWSNVLLAAYQPVIQSGTILISANAGPHELAGDKCVPNFFSASPIRRLTSPSWPMSPETARPPMSLATFSSRPASRSARTTPLAPSLA